MNTQTKQQTRKVGVAGGFINQLMGNNTSEPVLGEGATILHYSDKSAYEVIEVSDKGMSCVIRAMNCKNVSKCYGDEKYEYSSNPNGVQLNLEWNAKKKCWGQVSYTIKVIKGLRKEYKNFSKVSIIFGFMEKYRDPHF